MTMPSHICLCGVPMALKLTAYAVTSLIPTCPREQPSTAWCRQEDACPVLTLNNPSPLQSYCSVLGTFRRGCRQQQLSHLDLEEQQRAGSTQTTSAHCPVPPKPPLQLASRHALYLGDIPVGTCPKGKVQLLCTNKTARCFHPTHIYSQVSFVYLIHNWLAPESITHSAITHNVLLCFLSVDS